MKKNKGFTIIELLGVIVILGVISLIAVGSYTMYVNKTRKTAYDGAEKSMREAANGVFTDCMVNSGNSYLCGLYSVPKNDESRVVYVEDLIQGQYLDKITDPEQQGEFCDSLKSYVFVAGKDKTGSDNNNLDYKSCLYCTNYKSPNCDFDLVAGKDFGIRINMKLEDSLGADYYSEFTRENIWIGVTSLDPYQFGIKRIEYATNTSGPWTEMVNGQMTWNNEGITKILVRVTDNANNVSEISSIFVKIDRTAPTADFDIKGTLGSNNWYTSNVSIGVKNQNDGNGSGVSSARVDVSAIIENTTVIGTPIKLIISDQLGNSRTYQTTIRVDKSTPTVGKINLKGTLGSNNWYTTDVEITATGGSAGESGFSNFLSHSIINYDTKEVTVTLTTTAGNGLWASINTTFKVDRTAPSIPTGGGISLGSINGASGSIESTSGLTYYYLVKNSSSVPNQWDPSWTTNRSFATTCGQTYYGFSMAINGAGQRSSVRSAGSVVSGACCTSPSVGSACSSSENGKQLTCNGITRTCAMEDGGGTWVLTSGTINGPLYNEYYRAYCGCFSWNGLPYRTGGSAGYSVRLYEGNRLLVDYTSSPATSQFAFQCYAGCVFRWR